MTTGLPLMNNALTTLAKSVFLPLGLSAEVSVADAYKIYGPYCPSDLSSHTTALLNSNE